MVFFWNIRAEYFDIRPLRSVAGEKRMQQWMKENEHLFKWEENQ